MSSRTTARAAPERLAGLIRDYWGIESLHWPRDTIYRDNDSTAYTRSGPRVMAAFCTLTIEALHLSDRRDITLIN